MAKLQEVVRCLRHHGAFVNSSCGQHVHVDASNHTPRSLKNAMTIMYSKEDILFKALKVQPSRMDRYCRKVRPAVLEKVRKMPNSTISMEKLKNAWYLVDAANYLMLEFMFPQHKKAHFRATSSDETAGIVGISAVEMDQLKNQ